MGKGKGKVKYWVAHIYAGAVIATITNISGNIAQVALLKGARKLPLLSTIVTNYRYI